MDEVFKIVLLRMDYHSIYTVVLIILIAQVPLPFTPSKSSKKDSIESPVAKYSNKFLMGSLVPNKKGFLTLFPYQYL